MTEKLESKFEKFKAEFNNHPKRFMTRVVFEPGYALRNIIEIRKHLAKDNPNPKEKLPIMYTATIGFEIARLGMYGALAYEIGNHFIK